MRMKRLRKSILMTKLNTSTVPFSRAAATSSSGFSTLLPSMRRCEHKTKKRKLGNETKCYRIQQQMKISEQPVAV